MRVLRILVKIISHTVMHCNLQYHMEVVVHKLGYHKDMNKMNIEEISEKIVDEV